MEENIMFSKKSLPISIALILLIALSTLGLAYGAWTETLTINGTVSTGTFDVQFYGFYLDYAAPGCNATLSQDGHTLTVTIEKAYPGYHCGGGGVIRNLSSVPAKINSLVAVNDTVPSNFHPPAGLVWLTDTAGNVVPAGGSFVLAADSYGGGVTFDLSMPATEMGHEGETFSFSYTISAEQAP
jgi:hypothetical protein